jgi:hypothetical protein
MSALNVRRDHAASEAWRRWTVAGALARIEPEATRRPDAKTRDLGAQLLAIDLLTPLEAYDAMSRTLESYADDIHVAVDLLSEIYYSEISNGGALNTADPRTCMTGYIMYEWQRLEIKRRP